jgi:tRNA (guanine26-N2/guanine27-N2)-dimethyltransferase
MNDAAFRNARVNSKLNKLGIKVLGKSLQEFANKDAGAFDVIDIDPFGSPAPMIHDALKMGIDGTVMMVTATDTATLCGAEGSACLRIYASRPIHNELCHEAGVRILLNFIAREAAQFNFGIEPLLCIADMHYMRVFVRLHRGAEEAVKSVGSSGFGAYCSNCHNFSFQKGVNVSINGTCDNCGKKMQVFGPLWLGNLFQKPLLAKMLKLGKRYPPEGLKLIEKINGELDTPFFYSIPKITSYLKLSSVPMDLVLTSLRKRHDVSRTHFDKDAIKTTATTKQVIGAVRTLRQSHP